MNKLAPIRSSQEITKSRRIGFLIYPDCEICDVCGPLDVFHFADYWLPRFGRTDEPGYQLVILAATPGPVRTHSGIEIVATQSCYDIKDGLDTLVVAGGINVEQACKDDPALVEWVRAMAPQVRRVASICTGAFILAAAGPARDDALAVFRPPCNITPSGSGRFQPYLRSRREYLHFGRDHRRDRSGPGPSGRRLRPGNYARRRPDDVGFSAAPRRAIPIQSPEEDLIVPALADRVAMSPRNFARLFRSETGETPARFTERARSEAARCNLEQTVVPVETIAEQCGFGNAERMRRTFQRLFDISPQDYRARFRSTLLT